MVVTCEVSGRAFTPLSSVGHQWLCLLFLVLSLHMEFVHTVGILRVLPEVEDLLFCKQ